MSVSTQGFQLRSPSRPFSIRRWFHRHPGRGRQPVESDGPDGNKAALVRSRRGLPGDDPMIQAGAMNSGNTMDAVLAGGRSHKKSRHHDLGVGSDVGLLVGVSDAAQPCEP